MSNLVRIKGNRYGLNIWLSLEESFERIQSALIAKLKDGRKFFGHSKVSIEFSGYLLTQEEEQTLVDLIHTHTDMTVYCIVDETITPIQIKDTEEIVPEKQIIIEQSIPKEAAVFHQGTLRSGQTLDVDTGIIILGDVNPGAKVTAKGNVVVIGSLKGYVHAGNGGSDHAFVFALNMQPTQIRISRVIARSPDRFSKEKTEPQLAFLEDNRIVIDEVHHTHYKEFDILK